MLELFNLLTVYIGKKDFKKSFWDSEPFAKTTKPSYVKWYNAWKNRIKHYTPCKQPNYDDIPVDGIIETWNPKAAKGSPQITTVKISPMFDADTVQQYQKVIEAHPVTTVVKSAETAENLRAVVSMDIRFMIGCDQVWEFSDDDAPAAAAAGPAVAGPALAALPPTSPADDAAAPAAPDVDPCDFTKWDVLNLLNVLLPAQNYVADDFRARHSAHAGLLLCFMSPAVEAAFPDAAQALYAGYQDLFSRPASVEDVRRYPTVGKNAYTAEEARWFEATYDFLESELNDVERAKRMLPPKNRPKTRGNAPAKTAARAAATVVPVPPSPVATGSGTAETEDDEDLPICSASSRKRGRKARETIL